MTNKIGTCEACEKPDVELFSTSGHRNMRLCQACYDKDAKLAVINADNRKLYQNQPTFEVKSDIFNAGTIPIIKLQAMIQHDETIPEDRKDFALLEEIYNLRQELDKAILADEKALTEKKNTREAFRVNIQELVGKLRHSLQPTMLEKYRRFDVNYTAPKTVKPPKPVKTPTKKFSMKEAKAVSAQYGIPVEALQYVAVAHNLSAEEAAKLILQQKKN